MINTTARVVMSQLPSFSGYIGENADRFLIDWHRGMSAALVSPIQIYLLFPFYLKNEAKLWYELNFSDKKIPISDEEALVEWKKLIEEFKKKYNDLSRNESKRVTIKRRTQGDDENLIDYIKDMIDLGKGLDKKIIFDHCIVGMKVDYYKRVNEKQIKTLEDLLDSALVIQNDMEFDEKEDREKFERLYKSQKHINNITYNVWENNKNNFNQKQMNLNKTLNRFNKFRKCYSNNPVNLNHQAHLFNVNYGQRKYNTFYKNINTGNNCKQSSFNYRDNYLQFPNLINENINCYDNQFNKGQYNYRPFNRNADHFSINNICYLDQQNQKHQPRVRCFNQGRKYNNPNWSLKLPQNDVFSNLANLSSKNYINNQNQSIDSTSVEILSSMRVLINTGRREPNGLYYVDVCMNNKIHKALIDFGSKVSIIDSSLLNGSEKLGPILSNPKSFRNNYFATAKKVVDILGNNKQYSFVVAKNYIESIVFSINIFANVDLSVHARTGYIFKIYGKRPVFQNRGSSLISNNQVRVIEPNILEVSRGYNPIGIPILRKINIFKSNSLNVFKSPNKIRVNDLVGTNQLSTIVRDNKFILNKDVKNDYSYNNVFQLNNFQKLKESYDINKDSIRKKDKPDLVKNVTQIDGITNKFLPKLKVPFKVSKSLNNNNIKRANKVASKVDYIGKEIGNFRTCSFNKEITSVDNTSTRINNNQRSFYGLVILIISFGLICAISQLLVWREISENPVNKDEFKYFELILLLFSIYFMNFKGNLFQNMFCIKKYKDETLNPWKNRYKDNLILNDPLFK